VAVPAIIKRKYPDVLPPDAKYKGAGRENPPFSEEERNQNV